MTSSESGVGRRIWVFDTTLRDGEQSPGATMTVDEKLEMADALVALGVDIIEAGFPAASPGDFEAVRMIAARVKGAVDCRSRPRQRERHRTGRPGGQGCGSVPRPHVHRDLGYPSRAQAANDPGRGARPDVGNGRLRQVVHERCRVLGRRCDPLRLGLSGSGLFGGNQGRGDDAQCPGHRRIHHARTSTAA